MQFHCNRWETKSTVLILCKDAILGLTKANLSLSWPNKVGIQSSGLLLQKILFLFPGQCFLAEPQWRDNNTKNWILLDTHLMNSDCPLLHAFLHWMRTGFFPLISYIGITFKKISSWPVWTGAIITSNSFNVLTIWSSKYYIRKELKCEPVLLRIGVWTTDSMLKILIWLSCHACMSELL